MTGAPAEAAVRSGVERDEAASRASSSGVGRPDFVIAGAMKCASNTLHEMLRQHPRIYMPVRGMVFFAIDDQEQHPDFFVQHGGTWYDKDYRARFAEYYEWYRTFYAEAAPGQVCGEAAPTYLASERVPERLHELAPDVKLIFLLRDPVDRAYSQYWHEVFNGRMIYSFEDSIRFAPGTIINRSLYAPQLRRFLNYFPRENMHFELFEDFVKNVQGTLPRVLDFLGIDEPMPEDRSKHANQTHYRKYTGLHLMWNRWFRRRVPVRYYSFLPDMPEATKRTRGRRLIDRIYGRINPTVDRKPPPMDVETRKFLSDYFRRENEGIAELTGLDVNRGWKSFREAGSESSSAAGMHGSRGERMLVKE